MNSKICSIKHQDYFSFKTSEPNEKVCHFDMTIQHQYRKTYKATYSKSITYCFCLLDVFRREKITFDVSCASFIYVTGRNGIKIKDRTEIINQLQEINLFLDKNYKGHLYFENFKNWIEEFTEDEKFLDTQLLREISLIHEFENKNIPIGVSGIINEDDDEIIDLNEDEEEFLNQLDVEKLERIEVMKTYSLDKNTYQYDKILANSVLSSSPDRCTSIDEIISSFLESNIDIDYSKHISLNRDIRHLTVKNNELAYLLKEVMIHSESLHKINKLEILDSIYKCNSKNKIGFHSQN
jgi:hypothetical protein